ncbi:MAG: glycosyltransferase family 4 protein [Caldilineaceae bacterium]
MAELVSISVYTLLIAYTGVGNLRLWAERRLLAIPNERSSHTRPTPSGGGAAIVITTLLGLTIFAVLTNHLSPTLGFLLGGAALVAVISWLDDLYTMQSQVRLMVHGLGAVAVLVGAGALDQIHLPLVGAFRLGWVGWGVTFFWVVGLINAYNFMDGIDGLAGIQAVLAGGAWACFGYWIDAPLVMALGLLLAAGSLGFLGYNWPPARIFMGDVGSAFLGYSFALLTVLAAQRDARLAWIGVLVLWPFLFDTTFTLVRRWSRGENLLLAHRSHLYQRLVIAGHSHRTVTLLYGGLALLGGVAGMAWFHGVPGSATVIVLGLPTLASGLWLTVVYYEARPVNMRALMQ